jgi:thiamine-monophosphate kinase
MQRSYPAGRAGATLAVDRGAAARWLRGGIRPRPFEPEPGNAGEGSTVNPTGTPGTSLHPEIDLIEKIAASVTVRGGVEIGIGDDAAVLSGDPALVVTQDLLVEDVHFRLSTTDMPALGHKALAVNISDVAAMGAHPVAAVVGLALPREVRSGVTDFYAGMEALAAEHGCTIAGGDLTDAPVLMVSVTVIGRMRVGVSPVLRSGALPGDAVCVTGALGAAAAGLALLDGTPGVPVSPVAAEGLRKAYRSPTPRAAAGVLLAQLGAHAMLDCSDGLALDVFRMAKASGVSVRLDLDRVPIAPGVSDVAWGMGLEPDELASTGGDDYELIVALPAEDLARYSAALGGLPLTRVGTVLDGPPEVCVFRRGDRVVLPRLGWEHGA